MLDLGGDLGTKNHFSTGKVALYNKESALYY